MTKEWGLCSPKRSLHGFGKPLASEPSKVNTKAKGARAERRARAMLEGQGYTVVRAGGSLGPFDLVAFSREGLRLVQVKCNRAPRPAERQALAAFDNLPPGATKEFWRFRDRRPGPQIEVLS